MAQLVVDREHKDGLDRSHRLDVLRSVDESQMGKEPVRNENLSSPLQIILVSGHFYNIFLFYQAF